MGSFEEFLLWSAIINLCLLFVSFLAFTLARDFVYKFHGKWYDIKKEEFNAIIYSGMMFYKICIIFFNVVPYIVLRILE
jgi:small-conductance mechanosensitive channel